MTESDAEKQDAATKEKQHLASLLNANHRRVLASTLRRVELAAWRLERQIAQRELPQLALTRFINPPRPSQQSALLRLTKQIRQEVAELASDYDLEVGEENLLATIRAEFMLLWCDLEDARPQKLRAYGTVNPQAFGILGPRIQRLIDLLLFMNDVASGKEAPVLIQQEIDESNLER